MSYRPGQGTRAARYNNMRNPAPYRRIANPTLDWATWSPRPATINGLQPRNMMYGPHITPAQLQMVAQRAAAEALRRQQYERRARQPMTQYYRRIGMTRKNLKPEDRILAQLVRKATQYIRKDLPEPEVAAANDDMNVDENGNVEPANRRQRLINDGEDMRMGPYATDNNALPDELVVE